MPASFKLNDNIPTSSNGKNVSISDAIPHSAILKQDYEVLDSSKNKIIASQYYNGFIGLMLDAYNNHHNVSIRPDDIWITLLSQFSKYINADGNAEELRHKIVDFEGKKELKVIYSCQMRGIPFDDFIKKINFMIHENLKCDIEDWIKPNFSTSTDNDQIVANALLMTSLQRYFSYVAICMCGIPNVELLGNIEDWQNLRAKVEKFIEYDNKEGHMTAWVKELLPIMDKFIQSFTTPDIKWWNQVRLISGGSGAPHIDGWLLAFMRFTDEGFYNTAKKMDITEIPPSVANAPIKIIDIDGKEYNSTLYAGSFGYKKCGNGYSASNDWIVILDK